MESSDLSVCTLCLPAPNKYQHDRINIFKLVGGIYFKLLFIFISCQSCYKLSIERRRRGNRNHKFVLYGYKRSIWIYFSLPIQPTTKFERMIIIDRGKDEGESSNNLSFGWISHYQRVSLFFFFTLT